MLKTIGIIAVGVLLHLPANAQRITHAAIGSGAVRTQDASGNRMLSLAGQAVIGVVQSASATSRVGFLYIAAGGGNPVVLNEIEDVDLIVGGDVFLVPDLNTIFSDPDDDPLVFSAGSSNDGVATAVVVGNTLTVTPLSVGAATITVTARDGRGGQGVTSFVANVPTAVAVERSGEVPADYALGQNYPNPFNPSTAIHFDVPEATYVTLTVYTLTGQVAAVLEAGSFAAGRYTSRWDATGFASGLYIYRIQAGSYTATKKMLLLK